MKEFTNYIEIQKWLNAIGFPQARSQFTNFKANTSVTPQNKLGVQNDSVTR